MGETDGWQDLSEHLEMTYEYDCAEGNIALTGELDLTAGTEFTVAMSFADHRHGSVTALLQAIGLPFDHFRRSIHRRLASGLRCAGTARDQLR